MFEDRWCLWEPTSYPTGGSCSSKIVLTSSLTTDLLCFRYYVLAIIGSIFLVAVVFFKCTSRGRESLQFARRAIFPYVDTVRYTNYNTTIAAYINYNTCYTITRRLQLPHIPVTAFSLTDLFLVWICHEFRSPQGTHSPVAIAGMDWCWHVDIFTWECSVHMCLVHFRFVSSFVFKEIWSSYQEITKSAIS